MKNIKIILLIVFLFIIAGVIGIFLIEYEQAQSEHHEQKTLPEEAQSKTSEIKTEKIAITHALKPDLYSDSLFYIPLISIAEIASFPTETKNKIDSLLEKSGGCYFLRQNFETKDIFVILQNPVYETENHYPRHNLQMAYLQEGSEPTYQNIGYAGEANEIENAVVESETEDWNFDETTEPYRPLKHTVFDKKKNIIFSENWNYDESNPIKYEMRGAQNNVLSVMKETVDGENYRQEHVFYDEKGNTKISLTVSYKGTDIDWFSYYNAENPTESVAIESEYNNGLKTSEKIYTQDLHLKKAVTSEYKDGKRVSIKITEPDGSVTSTIEN